MQNIALNIKRSIIYIVLGREQSPDIPDSEAENHKLEEQLRYPEKNLVDHFEYLFRIFGVVTRKNTPRPKFERTGPERPLSVRRERARLYKLFRGTDKKKDAGKRKLIRNEARDKDDILRQFLKQGEVKVSSPELGEVSARYTEMDPPKERVTEKKPPIVLIPGLANDLECVDALAQELAFSGRKIIVIGHPDSWMGQVSPEFTQAVEHSPTLAPHARFFSEAIQKILPDAAELELWGFSTGGPAVMEMLASDPHLSKKVTEAVLINPIGAVQQTSRQLWTGLVKEIKSWISPSFSSYVLTAGREKGETPEAPGQRKLKIRVRNALMKRIREPSVHWSEAKVREDGRIVVVAGQSDDVTQCRKTFNQKTPLPNAQMKVVEFPGNHAAPLAHARELIEQVTAAQRTSV